jgi:hypothetical protein
MDGRTAAIIEELRTQNKRLSERIEQLEQENRQLREQLGQAQGAAMRQAAPFRRDEQRKIPPEQQKPPGRKPGHPGSCREVPQHIDETAEVPLEKCPNCGGAVTDCRRLEQVIEEIPPLKPRVVRVITYSGRCRHCGEVRSRHPLQTSVSQGAAKVQSLDLVRQAHHWSLGTVSLPALSFVEMSTRWWVGGPGWWLWAFTEPKTTVYRVNSSRGSIVVEDVLTDRFKPVRRSACPT